MEDVIDPWDTLASHFESELLADVKWGVADNILIAQPVILDFLAERLPNPSGAHLLEFGCGGGQFAARLASLGYAVEGMDAAPKMIAMARDQYGNRVPFQIGTSESLDAQPRFDGITSVMTLEFIADVQSTLERLSRVLKPSGILIFAAHNQDFVKDWIAAGRLYHAVIIRLIPELGVYLR